jgi:AraC family transcriptional regulator
MTLTNKAIWTIERNLRRPLTLSGLAEACGVSRHHLAHAFGAATGMSVMQYVRSRRLSEAAEALASGDAPDILNLALDAGYGSHEAFSRAFREQFGSTPETVRRKKSTEDLPMIKAMKAPDNNDVPISPPRLVSGPPMLLAGLAEPQSLTSTENIPGQWQRFMARYDEIPDKVSPVPLGVSTNMDDDGDFEYVCAAEVSRVSKLPQGFTHLQIPAQRYAVFQHLDHVSRIGATYNAIWNKYRDHPPAGGPILERHLETFDPQTGLGGIEIWIPIKDAV